MGAKTAKAGVSEFLDRFKARVVARELLFVPRKRNLEALAALGLTIDESEQIILNLTKANMSGEPEHDQKGSPGVVWFFQAFEGGQSLNIELKIGDSFAACLYFGSAKRHNQTNTHERGTPYEKR